MINIKHHAYDIYIYRSVVPQGLNFDPSPYMGYYKHYYVIYVEDADFTHNCWDLRNKIGGSSARNGLMRNTCGPTEHLWSQSGRLAISTLWLFIIAMENR